MPRMRRAVVLLILLGAFALRLHLLGESSIWWDEGLAVWAARKSLPEIACWTGADVHPPLYFWLLHLWRGAAGESAWVLRFLSAAVGTAMVAAMIPLGELLGSGVGTGAALLLALHPFAVWWSQEMRMYSLAALLALASTWALAGWVRRPRWRCWLGYVLASAGGLYTLYLSAFVLLAQGIATAPWLLRRRDFAGLARWALALLAVAVIFAPWAFYAAGHMRTWSAAEPFAFGRYLLLYVVLIVRGVSTHIERQTASALAGAGLILLSAASVGREVLNPKEEHSDAGGFRRWAWGMLLAWLAVPPLGVYAVYAVPHSFYTPKPEARYLLVSLPAFGLLLAWGARELARRPRSIRGSLAGWGILLAGAALACSALPGYYSGRWLRDDFISIAALLEACRRPDEGVILHTDKDWPVFAAHYPGDWVGIPNAQPLSLQWLDSYLGPVWEAHRGLWLVQTPDALRADPQHLVARWLASRGREAASYRVGSRLLTLYRREGDSSEGVGPLTTPAYARSFGDLTAGVPLRRVRVGDETALFACSSSGERFVLYLDGRPWREGELPRSGCALYPLTVPDSPGIHRIHIEAKGAELPLGRMAIAARREAVTPSPESAAELRPSPFVWEGNLRLLGYEIEPEAVRPGGTVRVTMRWQAGGPTSTRLVFFVHLLGEVYNAEQGNFLWGQRDAEPLNGAYPSTAWRSGREWQEVWEVPVHPDAPPGRYKLEAGWYDPGTGARLPLAEPPSIAGADHVILGEIVVEEGSKPASRSPYG